MSKKRWGVSLSKNGPILTEHNQKDADLLRFNKAKEFIVEVLEDQLEFYKNATPDNYKFNLLEHIYGKYIKETEVKTNDSVKRDT